MKQYKTIYADPPWNETGGGKIKRGADRHYPLMKTKDILAMAPDIYNLAEDNCHLYLWVTNNYLADGLEVMDRWGFVYKTMITWMKDRMGLGQYYRGLTEHCLFGVRGCLPYKKADGKRQQGKTGFEAPRTKHSEKPIEMREMIEKVSYAPYLELFARRCAPNWDVWGNEVQSDIALLDEAAPETPSGESRFVGVPASHMRTHPGHPPVVKQGFRRNLSCPNPNG